MNGGIVFKGIAVAAGMFALLGSVAALWPTGIFVRMTPAGPLEIAGLALTAALTGIFVAIRRPRCSVKPAGIGGVLGFLGVACPTCNKLLMLAFGGPLLMAYFEPVRLYLVLAGVALLAWAIGRELRSARQDRLRQAI